MLDPAFRSILPTGISCHPGSLPLPPGATPPEASRPPVVRVPGPRLLVRLRHLPIVGILEDRPPTWWPQVRRSRLAVTGGALLQVVLLRLLVTSREIGSDRLWYPLRRRLPLAPIGDLPRIIALVTTNWSRSKARKEEANESIPRHLQELLATSVPRRRRSSSAIANAPRPRRTRLVRVDILRPRRVLVITIIRRPPPALHVRIIASVRAKLPVGVTVVVLRPLPPRAARRPVGIIAVGLRRPRHRIAKRPADAIDVDRHRPRVQAERRPAVVIAVVRRRPSPPAASPPVDVTVGAPRRLRLLVLQEAPEHPVDPAPRVAWILSCFTNSSTAVLGACALKANPTPIGGGNAILRFDYAYVTFVTRKR